MMRPSPSTPSATSSFHRASTLADFSAIVTRFTYPPVYQAADHLISCSNIEHPFEEVENSANHSSRGDPREESICSQSCRWCLPDNLLFGLRLGGIEPCFPAHTAETAACYPLRAVPRGVPHVPTNMSRRSPRSRRVVNSTVRATLLSCSQAMPLSGVL